jgi:hypothetical protein
MTPTDPINDRTMDMAENASRRGAVDMGVILMVVALAVIAGFIFWLSGQAASERAMEIREDSLAQAAKDSADAAMANAGTLLTPTELRGDLSARVGEKVRLPNMEVVSRLGRQGFWIDPNSPFLISLSSELLADSTAVTPGGTVSLSGTLRAMNDSTSAAWLASGTVSQGDQIAASTVANFIEATRVEMTRASGGN